MYSILPPPIDGLVDLKKRRLQKAKRIIGIGPASVRHWKPNEVESQPGYPLKVAFNKGFVAMAPFRVHRSPLIRPIRRLFLKVKPTPALACHGRSAASRQSGSR